MFFVQKWKPITSGDACTVRLYGVALDAHVFNVMSVKLII